MVDPWGFMKNVLDAHGAWILGGAIVANLAHTANKKSKGFKRAAEWDYVKCFGCGRGGYSDEMRSGRDASGKDHYSCARCSRPDLFKQAESDQPQPTTDWQESGILTHTYPTKDPGYDHDNQLLYYLDWDSEDPYPTLPCIYCRTNLELFRVEKKISWDGKPFEHLIYKCNPCCLSTKSAEGDGSDVDNDLPAIGSRWRQRMWMKGPYDWETHGYNSSKYAPNRMTNNVLEILAHHTSIDPNDPQIVAFWVQVGGSSRYRIGEITVLGLDNLKHIYREEPGSVGRTAEEDSSKPCSHCDGTASFPREFYYQADRIEMVPCGTCITQGRCPGCMEIYPNLSRDNMPEDVFLGSGCARCGYTEADARAARKTARRWADLVDNPAAAKFMAEGDAPKVSPKASIQSFIDYEEKRTSNSPCDCHVCVDREPDDETKCYGCDNKYPFKTMVMFHGIEGVEANCKDCFTNAQTVTRHCPSCGGLSCGQQYGIPPYGFPMDEDGIYTTGTPYFLPISYTEDCEGWCESMSAEGDDDDYIECEGCSNSVSFARVMDVLGWRSDGYCDQCVEEHMEAEESFEDFRKRMVGDAAIAGDMGYMESLEEYYQDYLEEFERRQKEMCPDPKTFEQFQEMVLNNDYEGFAAEDYGVGSVWMADSYDPDIHGKPLPLGSVKRFLTKIPRSQMFHVDFVKSNGDIRSMDAFFNKPYQPDSNTANVMEVTGSGNAGFKRFRVDRVVSIWII